jgi:uncharacterized protein (TIGR03066 family)
MKRLISLILIAVVLFVCLWANAQNTDVLGKWYWSDGQLGMEMVFDFKADGTVIITTNIAIREEVGEGTWVMDGNQLTVTSYTGSEALFTFSDGQLTGGEMSVDGQRVESSSLVFSKGLMDSQAYVPGDIVTKPSLKDFEGEWTVYMLDFDGGQFPAEMAMDLLKDSDMVNLTIHGGTAFFSDADGENSGEIPCELLDGELVLKKVDGNVISIKCSLRLHKDGVISRVEDTNGKNTVIYYKKAQKESE